MLGSALEQRSYRCKLVEEAAILMIVAALRVGDEDLARRIREAIAPHLDELRFYPMLLDRAAPVSMLVSLVGVNTMHRELGAGGPLRYRRWQIVNVEHRLLAQHPLEANLKSTNRRPSDQKPFVAIGLSSVVVAVFVARTTDVSWVGDITTSGR